MAKRPASDELSDQELQFCINYLNPDFGFNATECAIAAGYSAKTAAQQASRLLSRAKVRAWLKAEQGRRLAKAGSKAERVIEELERIAFHDVRDVVSFRSVKVNSTAPAAEEAEDDDSDRDEDEKPRRAAKKGGALADAEDEAEALHVIDLKLRDSDQLDDAIAATIQSVQSDGKGGVKIRFHSKQAALDTLARHHGLLKPQEVKVTASDELIALLDQRRDRARGRRQGEEGETPIRRQPPQRPRSPVRNGRHTH